MATVACTPLTVSTVGTVPSPLASFNSNCPISAPSVTSVNVKSMAALSATVPAAFSTCTLTPTPTPASAAVVVVWLRTKASVTSLWSSLLRMALNIPPA